MTPNSIFDSLTMRLCYCVLILLAHQVRQHRGTMVNGLHMFTTSGPRNLGHRKTCMLKTDRVFHKSAFRLWDLYTLAPLHERENEIAKAQR